jgi:hypothetical protein
MKKLSGVLFVLYAIFFIPLNTGAGILGDIDGDGHVDITEALFALQLASGHHPNLPDSCIITGFGDWQTGRNYNKCDVVFLDGSFYICSQAHLSSAINNPPNDAYWANLALKGDTGPTGPSGSSGGQGPQGPPGVCHHVPLDTSSTYPGISLLPCLVTIEDVPTGGQFFGSVDMEALLHIADEPGIPQQVEITRNWPMQGSIDVKLWQLNHDLYDVIIETYVSGLLGEQDHAIVHGRWTLSNAYPDNVKYRYALDPSGQGTYVTETITLMTNDITKNSVPQGATIDIGDITTPPLEVYSVTIDVNEADGPTQCEPDKYEKHRRMVSFFDLQYTGSGEVEKKFTVRKNLFTFRDESGSDSSCIDSSYMEWVSAGTETEITIKGWSDPETTVIGFEITEQSMLPVSYDLYHIEDGLFETFTVESQLHHP